MRFRILALTSLLVIPSALHAQSPASPAPQTSPNPLLTPSAINPAQAAVNQLTTLPVREFNQLLQAWTEGVNLIWKNPRGAAPQEVLSLLGTKAGPLLDLSAKTAAYLESLKPGCTASAAANIKAVTVNTDGTVTVNP